MNQHIVPFKTNLIVILTLLGLTVLTVLAGFLDFGPFNVIIAMGIASAKAVLVLMYFMHLKYDDKAYLVIFLSGVFFLFVIFLFSMFDIITRVSQQSVL